MKKREYQVCSNCVMDTSDFEIKFDENGMCDHCKNYYENILPSWHTDERGKAKLDKLVAKIKKNSKNKKYDCIIGLSGGVDSSYLVYYAKEVLGLRVLVYSVDTGWNLDVANENIKKIVKGLDLELFRNVVDFSEMKDLQLAYFKSQVAYQDTAQDHVIFASLYNYAVKHKIKYVLTGGNYSTECVREPIEWVYQNDLKQIKDIHKKFGTMKLKKLSFCGMFKYKIYYRFFKGMKVYRPLDLIPYIKADVIKTLKEKFDWMPYANKHFESVFTRFYEGYWLVKKFGFDKRRAHFSSLILTKQLDRVEALEILKAPPYSEAQAMEDLEYISTELGISKEEFLKLMAEENKSYKDYKSSAKMISLAVKLARVLGIEKRNFR